MKNPEYIGKLCNIILIGSVKLILIRLRIWSGLCLVEIKEQGLIGLDWRNTSLKMGIKLEEVLYINNLQMVMLSMQTNPIICQTVPAMLFWVQINQESLILHKFLNQMLEILPLVDLFNRILLVSMFRGCLYHSKTLPILMQHSAGIVDHNLQEYHTHHITPLYTLNHNFQFKVPFPTLFKLQWQQAQLQY